MIGVHALAIATLPISFLGALALSRRTAAPGRLALAALVAYTLALLAGLVAAGESLAVPGITRQMLEAEPAARDGFRCAGLESVASLAYPARMRVAIAGASGLIGTQLTQQCAERGDEVVKLPRLGTAPWSVESADAVVNLAGANIAGRRWNAGYKQEIENSRVLSTRALVEAISRAARKPRVLVNASAVGFYGPRGDELLDESAPAGADFLARVVQAWEAEARRAKVRAVQIRTGVVLSRQGGALQQMLLPFKAFVGGPIGSGKQWFPWIHIADEVAAILSCIDRESLSGPVNLVAPGIVTMKEFAKALGRALHRPSWAPVPAAALRIAMGEAAEALASGQRAVPKKLLESGFQFRYPELAPALADLLR